MRSRRRAAGRGDPRACLSPCHQDPEGEAEAPSRAPVQSIGGVERAIDLRAAAHPVVEHAAPGLVRGVHRLVYGAGDPRVPAYRAARRPEPGLQQGAVRDLRRAGAARHELPQRAPMVLRGRRGGDGDRPDRQRQGPAPLFRRRAAGPPPFRENVTSTSRRFSDRTGTGTRCTRPI